MVAILAHGTRCIGKMDKMLVSTYGQTHVTTKWIVIGFLPVIPLVSYRVYDVTGSFGCLYRYGTRRNFISWNDYHYRKHILMSFIIGWMPVFILLEILAIITLADKYTKLRI